MQTIQNQAAQGDVLFVRVSNIPKAAVQRKCAGDVVVTHSETGHHHVAKGQVRMFEVPGDPLTAYLSVDAACGSEIVHNRSFDTHAPFVLPQGIWAVRRQREYTPEGWRRVED